MVLCYSLKELLAVVILASTRMLILFPFQYIRLPPAYTPYILRVSLEAGTPASRNGVFKTNFPLEGGRFDRNNFCEKK